MGSTLAAAKYMNELNVRNHGCNMDQMKMHKMMYLSQRESLMIYKYPLFDDEFQAWKYGPVLTVVRTEYMNNNPFSGEYGELCEREEKLVNSVFERYDQYTSWELSTLSHAEYSWNQARKGLKMNEQGHTKLSLSAIKVDATREFLRREGVVLD